MNTLKNLRIVFQSNPEEKLASLNRVNLLITGLVTHRFWCANELPFGAALGEFAPGAEPVACWVALNEEGAQVGHAELHRNGLGWVLARLWVDASYRNKGLARKIWMKALDYTFQHADKAGCFCDVKNVASKKLQLSMGFRLVKSLPEVGMEYFRIDRATYTQLKRSGRGKLSLAFARLPKTVPAELSSQRSA